MMKRVHCKSFSYPIMMVAKAHLSTATPSTTTSSAAMEFGSQKPLPTIIHEKRDRTSIVTINKPKYLNACNEEMMETLYAIFKATETDQNTDILVLKGSGRAFCAGGDLQSFVNGSHDPMNYEFFNNGIDYFYRSLYKLAVLKTPTVTLMDGLTVGFGVGLSYGSNFRIATENTFLLMPETGIGHFCDASTSYYLSRLDGHYGRYLTLCSRKLKADDVMLAGIASHFVPSSKIPSLIRKLVNLQSPDIETIDKEINKFAVNYMNASLINIDEYREKRRIINDCFRFETVEEIVEALEKEGSEFSLASKAEILRGSPQALKVTLELLCRAQSLTLKECILLERQLWRMDVISHDFLEGCISKMQKRKPAWSPDTLSKLNFQKDIIDNFFGKASLHKRMELEI